MKPSADYNTNFLIQLQRTAGNLAVSRLFDVQSPFEADDFAPATAQPPTLSDQDVIDAETGAIAETLNSFRQVSITLKGPAQVIEPPPIDDSIGGMGGGAALHPMINTPTKTVTVHAAYFISAGNAQTAYHSEAAFKRVADALKEKSLIVMSGTTKAYPQGVAVTYGKSTAADVKAFVEEAISQGAVKTYAHSKPDLSAMFPPGKNELWDLDDANLQTVIQSWVLDKGVGVDCSGFVLQASIAIQEKIKAKAKEQNMAVPADWQTDLSHVERSASSFKSGPKRASPTDIKLGDAWVIGNHHVRIVASTPVEADGQIQFDADESYGDVDQTAVGPILHTWRTHSKTAFDAMLRLKDGGDPSKKADYETHGQGEHGFYAIH